MTSSRTELLRVLAETSEIHPTMRFGQIVANLASLVDLSPGAVWVTNRFDDTVTEIDATTGRFKRTFDAGPGPSDIAYGLGALWITNESSSTVTRPHSRESGANRRSIWLCAP